MAKRSIEKAIADYRGYREKKKVGDLYYSDFQQLKELTLKECGDAVKMCSIHKGGGVSYWYAYTGEHLTMAILNAFDAGYMIGYRTAQRHSREKHRKEGR